MNKKRIYLSGITILSVLLTACQMNPSKNMVVSKNDGSFDISIVESASVDHNANDMQSVSHTKIFSATDHSVNFEIDIDAIIAERNMPVVEVAPHYITESEAKNIATILLGDTIFYEKDTLLSRDEIQQCVSRWSRLTSEDAMRELFSTADDITIAWHIDKIKANIKTYTMAFESAPEEDPHNPCDWTYKKDSYYSDPQHQEHSADNDSIQATAHVDNIPYVFSVSTRNGNDYKLNSVFVYPREINMYDNAIYTARLCRTSKPTNEQIEDIRLMAESMLEQMNIGQWNIDQCYLETNSKNEHIVHINAVPVLNGVSALRLPQLDNLKSQETFASNYYLTNVSFNFSPNGDLLFFELQSPIDICSVINDNVSVLPFTDLMNRVEEVLSHSDIYAYDFNDIVNICKSESIDLGCSVSVKHLDYNLIRVKKPNTDNNYYYVPGYLLSGNIEFYNKATGDVFCSREDTILLAINAVDGTIINQ